MKKAKLYGTWLLVILLPLCFSDWVAADSIQGKQYANRTNGIYDLEISNQTIATFLAALKQAVESNDAEQLSQLVDYPAPTLKETFLQHHSVRH